MATSRAELRVWGVGEVVDGDIKMIGSYTALHLAIASVQAMISEKGTQRIAIVLPMDLEMVPTADGASFEMRCAPAGLTRFWDKQRG
jgi:hypothetical protein